MSNNVIEENFTYHLKESFLTKSEQTYMDAIKPLVPAGYYLQPQVNLASIIEKTKSDGNRFQNELYRNVDFCIFDTIIWYSILLGIHLLIYFMMFKFRVI